MAFGSSRRVSTLIESLPPACYLADPTLPPPPVPTLGGPTPGGMRALAHHQGQGGRTVHGARLAPRRLAAGAPYPPDPRRPDRARPAPRPPEMLIVKRA